MKRPLQPVATYARRVIAALGLVVILLAAQAQAQTYQHPISLQDLLLGVGDDPLRGNYDLTFRLYDTIRGGSVLREATHRNVLGGDIEGPSAGGDGLIVGQVTGIGVSIDQTGSNGIQVNQAGVDGLQIQSAGRNGIQVNQAGIDGLQIQSAGRYGLVVAQANSHGVIIGTANDGVNINTANGTGFLVNSTGNDGVFVNSAGRYGLQVVQASSHGVLIGQAVDGVNIGTANGVGVKVGSASGNGLQVDQAGVNGLQIGSTTFDGIQIQSAGRDGIRVTGAGSLAGRFEGDVDVNGTLTKSGGSFKIDHPLDPAGKYLSHSFVESPDMMNVYNGNVVLGATGEAVVELPAYFEALNRDFRYQLTAVGAPGPNLHVAEKINGNRFRIAGGSPGMEVSWQVTGIRQDSWANEHRIVVEQDKPVEERGYYLHPKLFGQPETRNVIRIDTPGNF